MTALTSSVAHEQRRGRMLTAEDIEEAVTDLVMFSAQCTERVNRFGEDDGLTRRLADKEAQARKVLRAFIGERSL